MSEHVFWWQDALEAETRSGGSVTCPALVDEKHCDIAIIGGGYTGLWTAIEIKRLSPEKRVAIIEKSECGRGASGRNGGCMLTFSSKYPSLKKYFGEAEAKRLVIASENAVSEIAAFCRDHNINAELRVQGVCYTASNRAQLGVMPELCRQLDEADLNCWSAVSSQKLETETGSNANIQAYLSPKGASVQPAKLVRGLRRVALAMGIEIYEHSDVKRLEHGKRIKIHCDTGSLRCEKLIVAANGCSSKILPELKNSVALVSSDMLMTEQGFVQEGAIKDGRVVADSRTFVNYYRSNEKGRLMFGKGGNFFSFGNRYNRYFDSPGKYQHKLLAHMRRFFPTNNQLHDPLAITHSWTGASDRSVKGLPFFGRSKKHHNIFYGLGYSGNGIVQSYLGGKFLSALSLGINNEWSKSPMAGGCQDYFPIEPFRYLGAQTIKAAIDRKEAREDLGLKARIYDQYLARFAASAAKADTRS